MDTLAIIAVILTALLLLVEHVIVIYIWQKQMISAFSYATGTITIWIGFCAWAIPTGNGPAALVLAAVIVFGGGLLFVIHLLEHLRDGLGHQQEAAALRRLARGRAAGQE